MFGGTQTLYIYMYMYIPTRTCDVRTQNQYIYMYINYCDIKLSKIEIGIINPKILSFKYLLEKDVPL